MRHRSTVPGTPPRKRPCLVLLAMLGLFCCLAAAPAWAQVDRRPFNAGALGGSLFGAEKAGVEQSPKGPLESDTEVTLELLNGVTYERRSMNWRRFLVPEYKSRGS